MRVGAVDTPQEREAEAVARSVVGALQGLDAAPSGCEVVARPRQAESAGVVQRSCAACARQDDEITVQRRPHAQPGRTSSVGVDQLSQARQGGGTPLPIVVRQSMESRLGHDFSLVRIHAGPAASTLAEQIGAEAFTVRRDIFMRAGHFQPDTRAGQHLLAHELVHTIQQRAAGPGPGGLIQRRASVEDEADSEASVVAPSEREYDGPAGYYEAVTECSSEQLAVIERASKGAVAILERAQSRITSKPAEAEPVLRYFLGVLDEKERKTLRETLRGVQRSVARLPFEAERYRCGDATGSYADYLPLADRYYFNEPFFGGGATTADAPQSFIHEVVHEYLARGGEAQTDFSFAHGVVPLVPLMAGDVHALRNAENVSAAAVALGTGDMKSMRAQAEPTLKVEGFKSADSRLLGMIARYAEVMLTRTKTDFVLDHRQDWVDRFFRSTIGPAVDDVQREIAFRIMRVVWSNAALVVYTAETLRGPDGDDGAQLPAETVRVSDPAFLAEHRKASEMLARGGKIDREQLGRLIALFVDGYLRQEYIEFGRRSKVIDGVPLFWRKLVRHRMLFGSAINTPAKLAEPALGS